MLTFNLQSADAQSNFQSSYDFDPNNFDFFALSEEQQAHLGGVARYSLNSAFEQQADVEAADIIFEGKQEIKRRLPNLHNSVKIEAINLIAQTPSSSLEVRSMWMSVR